MKALIVSSSPRRDGNSGTLAVAVREGLVEAGHEVEFVYTSDFLDSFLKDCRQCRQLDGTCSIKDGFRSVFLDYYLPAQGFIAATPIYWYGVSAQLKAFFDRTFCYYAASYPQSRDVVEGMKDKRIGLVLSSEESFPAVSCSIVTQIQEYSRYTHSTFVGVIHGYGNSRGEVRRDPNDPISCARRFGREFFTRPSTDYNIDTPRSNKVWT
jgi:multimeric flavodoxin WrbA